MHPLAQRCCAAGLAARYAWQAQTCARHAQTLCCLPQRSQQVELKATKVVHVGGTDPAEYPLAKKKQVGIV